MPATSPPVPSKDTPAADPDDLAIALAGIDANPAARAAFEDASDRHGLLDALVTARGTRSQIWVAQGMGTTQSAVSDLESGKADPRLSTLQRYARAVDCSLEVVLRQV